MAEIVSLQSLTLGHIRTFESEIVKFPSSPVGGQWIVLLGNNGAGKSTILRAVVMALGDREAITRFLEDAKSGGSHVRTNSKSGTIRAEISTVENPFEVILTPGTTDKIQIKRSATRVGTRPFIAAYGSLRGLGTAAMLSRKPADLIASLFVPQSPLLDPEVWLIQNKLAYYENDEGRLRFDKIVSCICGLLPDVKNIEVLSSRVEVVFENGNKSSFSALSDGYLTTAAWVLDMIAGWISLNPESASHPEPVSEQMVGIALVDEIDLHLHPVWQRNVVAQIRGAFPNMSFITTTHSPLTIMDLRPGELFVVEQLSLGDVSHVRQVDLRPGDVDDILTGFWFQLGSTLDSSTEQLMERHRLLLASGKEADDPEVQATTRELRKRLDGFGVSSVDQIVQSVANQVITESLEEMTPDQRESARQSLLELVRQKLR